MSRRRDRYGTQPSDFRARQVRLPTRSPSFGYARSCQSAASATCTTTNLTANSLNAALDLLDGKFLVTLAGTNLTDSEVLNGGFDFGRSLGFASAYMYPPRMWSLAARYKF